jgi:hypothetical protein
MSNMHIQVNYGATEMIHTLLININVIFIIK